ncbi:hypothetical protein [Fusibacter sp. JL216-2]
MNKMGIAMVSHITLGNMIKLSYKNQKKDRNENLKSKIKSIK